MFAVFGMVFCPQIIIDRWSTLGMVSPTPSEKHSCGPVRTCLPWLPLLFGLRSLLTDGVQLALVGPLIPLLLGKSLDFYYFKCCA